MIVHSLREWSYLPIKADTTDTTSIDRKRADQLLALAAPAAKRLKLGGFEGERILANGVQRLRAGQVVGVLATGDVRLEILPKISQSDESQTRESLVRMLARTLNLRIANGRLTQLGRQRHDLLEILISLFCEEMFDAVHRGLPRRYVDDEDDLTLLRGRLNLVRQFTILATSPQRLACRFDDLSHDVPLNRTMKAAIKRLRSLSRAASNQRHLHELELVFAEVTDVRPSALLWHDIVLDRTNAAWHSLVSFAKLLLSDRFQTTSSGAHTGFSLLFEMNKLFEEFIGRTLKAALSKLGIRVKLQGERRHALTDANGNERFTTIPDATFQTPGGVNWIIDTKWKTLSNALDDPQHGIAQADVYQMMAYSQVYNSNRLLLLYPNHDELQRRGGRIAEFKVTGTDDTILVIATVDLKSIESVPAQLVAILNGGLGSR